MKLINDTSLPQPTVRDISATNYGCQAKIAADNLYGAYGWTITYGPATKAGMTSGTSASSQSGSDSDSDSGRTFQGANTTPLVPQFLVSDRGMCPIPLPMLLPRPPVAAASPSPTPLPPSQPAATTKPVAGQAQPGVASEQRCESYADVSDNITLSGPSCPFNYPQITVQVCRGERVVRMHGKVLRSFQHSKPSNSVSG